MPKFRRKPVEVEATILTLNIEIETREGKLKGQPGDWLITAPNGEVYLCGDDIFRRSYGPASAAGYELLYGKPRPEGKQRVRHLEITIVPTEDGSETTLVAEGYEEPSDTVVDLLEMARQACLQTGATPSQAREALMHGVELITEEEEEEQEQADEQEEKSETEEKEQG